MEKKNMSKRIIRCCGPALLLVAAVLLLGTGTAFAGVTTGIAITKSCPATVQQGQTFTCTFTVQNLNPDENLNFLDVENTVPVPGGVPGDVECRQPDFATGTDVETLAPFGDPNDICFGEVIEIAPITCDGVSCTSNLDCSAPTTCNTVTGGCVFTDQVTASGIYDSGNFTSSATTNSPQVLPVVCNDDLLCTDDSCDPTNPITDPNNPAASLCEFAPITCEPDSDLCTLEACDPADGVCKSGDPTTCEPDSDLCTLEACDPADGVCKSGDPTTCEPDSDLCTLEACDPADGVCKSGDPTTCPDDGDLCTAPEECVPATGACAPTGSDVVCDDPVCTVCTPSTGVCDPRDPLPPECEDNEEICRTPGFWGTHGGTEKEGSENITQAVLDEIGPLTICGVEIDNTTPHFPDTEGDIHSAKEAICVSPKGDSVLQLARQLTAAALNCGVTNSTGCGGAGQTAGNVCNNVSIEDIFNACNDACAGGFTTPQSGDFEGISCIDAIDCFNNGGTGLIPGPEPGTTICVGDSGCHDRPLVNGCFDFPNPGPAGSPKGCNAARKNDVEITD
jgi:hypothetical protein